MTNADSSRSALASRLATLAIAAFVAMIYWRVNQAAFVWDDTKCIHDAAWLRAGDTWKSYLFAGFCEWNNYFRPLGVALMTLEVRTFSVAPGPMHLVSLALHLVNMLLVGNLARIFQRRLCDSKDSWPLTSLAMLIYGIHPALVEPVVWIGCQFDLLVTFFLLLAVAFNITVRNAFLRAAAVSVAFFLAACSKETAAAIPPVLFLLDVLLANTANAAAGWRPILSAVLRRQWPTYAALALTALAYLALRRLALGHLVLPTGHLPFATVGHLQEICWLLLTFLRVCAWPMLGLGPLHIKPEGFFQQVGPASLAIDCAAAVVLALTGWLAWRRLPLGICLLCMLIALLPVLHVLPVAFNESLYHERYTLPPIAIACVLLPAILLGSRFLQANPLLKIAGGVFAALWITLATLNVRANIPLWSNDLELWRWALTRAPDSVIAKDHLLTTYMQLNMTREAHALAEASMTDPAKCVNCVLNAANVFIAEGDAARADAALKKLDKERIFLYDPAFLRDYVSSKARLLELQRDLEGAEVLYREAIRLDPLDPTPQSALARLLASRGHAEEARKVMNAALKLFAPDRQAEELRAFEATIERAADHSVQ